MTQKEEVVDRTNKLDLAQAVVLFGVSKIFTYMAEIRFSFRHPILDWNRCYGNTPKVELKIKGLKGVTARSISRGHFDTIRRQYHYALIEQDGLPGKFYVIKYYNDFTREEVLALDQFARDHFNSTFSLPGYKPDPTRELTAKPHQEKEESFDPRYGTYQSTNR
jgi:hypothetical protein